MDEMKRKEEKNFFVLFEMRKRQNYKIMEQPFRCIFKCDSSFYSKLIKLNEEEKKQEKNIKHGMTGYL